MSDFAEAFGRQLVTARFFHDRISQEAVALRAGIHRTNMSTYEMGRRSPGLEKFVRLAGALDLSAAELLGPIRWEPGLCGPGRFVFEEEA